jgi:cellulose synthase/poly-beta-1,6-N-acetylglucosamine synthase-like glycosyltransferase
VQRTPNDRVDVSVLVPVLNEEQHLRAAAEAILDQEFEGTFEILFIDGGSSDGTPAIITELAGKDPRVRVLENPFRRTPHALNIGLASARGEFIARMDAHTIYPKRYLAVGVGRLRRGDVASVSGPQIAVGVSPWSRRVALALTAELGTGGAGFRRESDGEIEVDTGFTGVWRRSTLDAHGGWDEEFVNDQDMELAARIREAGGRIVCVPEMAASYIPRDTLQALARQYLRYGRYRVKTTQRHPGSLRRSQLLPPALVLTVLAAVASPSRVLRRAGRAGLGAYSATLVAASARAGVGGDGAEAVALPLVWATMHVSYGLGFLLGCVDYGPPLAGMRWLVESLADPSATEQR